MSINLNVKLEEIEMGGCTVPLFIETGTARLHFWAAVTPGIVNPFRVSAGHNCTESVWKENSDAPQQKLNTGYLVKDFPLGYNTL